jgi:chromosome segregation ATPase
MSEEKLDFIIKQIGDLQKSVGGLESRMGSLESRMGSLESRMDQLEKEFGDFKNKVLKALQTLQTRINTLESQLLSIGLELKLEIKHEIKEVREDINSLENKIMLEQAEKLQSRVRVRELESRLAKLEEKFRLAA